MKSGFVTIIGKPNVGKSTLINNLIGKKIAITSPKPQTTRNRISGVLTKSDYQIVFVDTPGMHVGKELLNKQIDKIALSSIRGMDAIILVVDRKKSSDDIVLKRLADVKTPVFLVINKIDSMSSDEDIDRIILSYTGDFTFKAVIPISATKNKNIDKLIEEVLTVMPEGPKYYPDDMFSDQSDNAFMAELIREKILYHTEQEVPHAVAVIIESIKENDEQNTVDVSALIIVERPSQKQIIIGKAGEKIKSIGTQARKDINYILNTKIHLTLWVKVKKDWRNNPSDIRRFGYNDEQ